MPINLGKIVNERVLGWPHAKSLRNVTEETAIPVQNNHPRGCPMYKDLRKYIVLVRISALHGIRLHGRNIELGSLVR
jgi:hypothetical protein